MFINKLYQKLRVRIPGLNQTLPVYAVISLILYSWTFYWFLYELPAWFHYLKLSEILNLYFRIAVVNLLESLVLLVFILLLCIVLPYRWLLGEFIYRGTALSLFTILYSIALAVRRTQILVFSTNMITWFPFVLAAALILIILGEKIPYLKKAVEAFADRAIIIFYLHIPISVLAIFVIAVKTIL